MTLAEARKNIGRKVVFLYGPSEETGVIVSVSIRYVFVRYGSDRAPKATSAEVLELVL